MKWFPVSFLGMRWDGWVWRHVSASLSLGCCVWPFHKNTVMVTLCKIIGEEKMGGEEKLGHQVRSEVWRRKTNRFR